MSEIPKQKKGKWTEENMNAALKLLLENKMTQRQAAETFNVSKTTLGNQFRAIQAGKTVNLTPQMGKFKRTFCEELEKQLVSYVKDQDAMPFSKKEFLKFAYDLAKHLNLPHQFKKEKKTAGKQFYYDFIARHPDLSLRTPQSTSIQRMLGFSRHQVERFFNKYTELLAKYNFSASRIHNCD
ncbi:pogo transposable element with krab domain-like protein [Lasius niger]|uniref:Pogo transposable element with krab domain-like protein n=1 Tax=Lasius niger TaxID=67767 RepID=A0A0J7JYH3_LASNI|nr:pogo transposable element with krab domain-like protein [Lasius niger]